MNVERGRVVSIHYELTDPSGTPIGATREGDPVAILYGYGGVLPGIEQALAGHPAGDRFQLVIPPEGAFGPRLPSPTQRVSKKHVFGGKRLSPGKTVYVRTRQGPRLATVLKVGSSVVDIDPNHPLAGVTVHADIEIVAIRAADRDEIAHGHVHRRGGDGHRAGSGGAPGAPPREG